MRLLSGARLIPSHPKGEPIRLTVLDDVTWDDHAVAGHRPRALLRALATAGPRGCSESALIEAIWGDELPDNPSKSLHVVVSRCRAATSTDAIQRTEVGYRLNLSTDDVDSWALRPEGLRLAQEGDYAAALPLLARAEADDEVLGALLRAEAAVHGVSAALQRYEEHRRQLADTLGIDPSPQLQALQRTLLAADQPVRSGVRYDANDLIGRDADIAALSVHIRTHRLTSIVGSGGLGKTRLAHSIARTAEQPVVHFVELASVTSAEGVRLAVADSLGVRESAPHRPQSRQTDLTTRIVESVGSVATLLVLDNCEHVITAAADFVSELLSRAATVSVLTTTRSPLNLAAEQVYLLSELSANDGVKLFSQRARSVRPDVVLEHEQVRELVNRLDGLPLAVELAAAKVRVMSVAEIARRLDNRFALLQGGSHDTPERHQTLLAVIDWSWNLLSESERVALRRLSVFRDGFSLASATSVIDPDDGDALTTVTSLVNQSLLVVQEDGEVRYRMLETVREFGRMQLVDAGDDPQTQRRLIEWAMNFSNDARQLLHSPRQVEQMMAIRHEEGNLVDILRLCLNRADLAGTVTIFGMLSIFWTVEGAHLKVFSFAPEVERLIIERPTPDELADCVRASLNMTVLAATLFGTDANNRSWNRLEQLGPGDCSYIAPLTRILLEVGPTGIFASAETLTTLAEDPDPDVARTARLWAAHVYENTGDLTKAQELSQRALQLCDSAIDGPWMSAMLTAQLCEFALSAGDYSQAREYALQAITPLEELGARDDLLEVRMSLAMIAIHQGEVDQADRIVDEVARGDLDQSIFGGALRLRCNQAELQLAHGDIEQGLQTYLSAVELSRATPSPFADWRSEFLPWVVLPQAAVLAAACQHADSLSENSLDRAEQERTVLLSEATCATGGTEPIDIPILGCALFALASWEELHERQSTAATLLALANDCAFNRSLPTFNRQLTTPPASSQATNNLRDRIHSALTQLSASRA